MMEFFWHCLEELFHALEILVKAVGDGLSTTPGDIGLIVNPILAGTEPGGVAALLASKTLLALGLGSVMDPVMATIGPVVFAVGGVLTNLANYLTAMATDPAGIIYALLSLL